MSKTTVEAAPKPENPLMRYYRDTKGEVRKVSWPTRAEATNLTLIVLGVTAAMAVFLGVIDYIFATLIRLIVAS